MGPGTITTRYFDWLYDQIHAGEYLLVCERMHQMPFKVLVDHDENRVGDAGEQRRNFIDLTHAYPLDHADLMFPDATVFEVLVCMARRAEYQNGSPMPVWFGIFLENLGLRGYTDTHVRGQESRVDRILARFNDRLYLANGKGGLFPLQRPRGDQRLVELWYQMSFYLTENHLY